MTDSLTLEFKEYLKSHGVVATDTEIEAVLNQRQSQPPSTVSIGGKVHTNALPSASPFGTQGMPEWYTGKPKSAESKIDLYEAVGSGLWDYFDLYAFGIPGVTSRLFGVDPLEPLGLTIDYEKRGISGKVTGALGTALGFMKPLRWIEKGASLAVSTASKMGGKRVVSDLVKGTGVFKKSGGILEKGTALGFEKDVLAKTLSKEFKTTQSAKALAAYGVSGEAIALSKSGLKTNLMVSLDKAFPKMEPRVIDELTDAIVLKLGEPGFHINSVGHWLQRVLGKGIGLKEGGLISNYSSAALEMTASFSMYNILTNGIKAMAGEAEFDPAGAVWDAFAFSAFLPLINHLPGGGKIPIYKTAKDIWNYKKVGYDGVNYGKYGKEELTGLIKLISENNALRETAFGEIAVRNVAKGIKTKKEAVNILERIRKTAGVDKMWKEFTRKAGADLGASTWRMMAGAAYFNSETLLDEDFLRNVEPEVLGAHLLIGAFFTRMRKPIFPDKYPMTTDFQSKVELLRNFGIDASSLKQFDSSFDKRHMVAGAQSGALSEERVGSMYNIIYDESILKEVTERKNIGEEIGGDIKMPEYNLLRQAKVIADIRRFNEQVNAGDPENYIELEYLTEGQANKMKERLEKEVIVNKETGEKLNAENVRRTFLDIRNKLTESGAKRIVSTVYEIAHKLGLQPEGKASSFNLDKSTIRIPDLIGSSKEGMGAFVEYQKIVNDLKENGYISGLEPVTGRYYEEIKKDPNFEKLAREVQSDLDSMTENLKNDNFPENFNVTIHPSKNAWLDLMGSYKSMKTLSTIHDAVTGVNMQSAEVQKLHRTTLAVLGKKLPPENLIRELVKIDPDLPPENMKEETWKKLKAGKEFRNLEDKLHSIAKVWSQYDGNRSGTSKTKVVSFEEAGILVGTYEKNYANSLKEGFLDKFTIYHNQEKFLDMELGHRESGIMYLAEMYNVLHKSLDETKWSFMSRDQVEKILKYRDSMDETMIAESLRKYDKIRKTLGRIDGKYIEFKEHLEKDGPNQSDVRGFIDEAYKHTQESNQEILKSYERVIQKSSQQGLNVQAGQSIIDKLYDGDTQAVKRLSLSDTREISLEIDKLLQTQKSSKDKNAVDQQFITYFERLKGMIDQWQSSKMDKPFLSSESNIKDGNRLILRRAHKISQLQQEITRIATSAQNTLWGQRNAGRVKDEIIAVLTSKLKKLEPKVGKSRTLEELYEWYSLGKVEPDRKIDAFIEEVKVHRIAFEENMSPEKYDILRQEIAREREIISATFDTTPKETYQTIENKYGEFNENLRGDNLQSIKEGLSIAVKKNEGVRAKAYELLNEIHDAIDTKNFTGDSPPSKKQLKKSKKEKIKFNRRFPGVLSHAFGTSTAKVISYSEDGSISGKNKTELVIELRQESDGANASFQEKIFKASEAEVYNVGKSSVYNNRVYNDYDDIPLTASKKNDRFESPAVVRDETGSPFSKRTGVKITISRWDQLYLRTDNFTNKDSKVASKFKTMFDSWYDNIMNQIPTDLGKQNFEIMYGEYKNLPEITQKNVLREIIKAMYWSHLSEKGFIDMISASRERQELNRIGSDLMKYFHYMAGMGPQVRGSKEFLNTVFNIGEQQRRDNGFWWGSTRRDNWNEIKGAIIDYNRRGNFRILSIDDLASGLSAVEIAKKKLKERLDPKDEGTDKYEAIKEMLLDLDKGDESKLASIMASSMDAQSWLSTNAAHLVYLHRGRSIYDDLAGVKPVGWSNTKDILLKTNFVHDRDIGDLLQRAGIDILTTRSAAKRFGPGHTSLKIDGRDIKATDYEGYNDAFTKAEESLKNGMKASKGKIDIEDLFIGKTTDRKMTNVSYALANYLTEAGYGAFTQHLDYYKKIENELGEIGKINDPNLAERNHYFAEHLKIAKEEGDILSDAASGALERIVREGVDVQSFMVLPLAERMIVKRVLGAISKPKTPYGSHSVLVPYLEGSMPVYGKIGGVDKQISFGGKKVSYFDGETTISDFGKLKFVVEYQNLDLKERQTQTATPRTLKPRESYDIQIGFEDGKLVVNDPYTGKELPIKSLGDAITKRLNNVKKIINNNVFKGNPTLKTVHDLLQVMNKSASKVSHGRSYSDIKIYLHSLSLRIPNIGGDVAVHKIEGFYDESMGNVVGINPMDLSVKHQGDFDVDMAHSYHDMPFEVSRSITDNLAKTPDAREYPPENKTLDIFNMGDEIGPVGVNQNLDSLEPHYSKYRNAQSIFGSIMNIAPALGAIERLDVRIGENQAMMNLNSPEFIPIKQRLKNVLKSIVDSTKTDNFASLGSREEVMKYVLFGRSFPGSDDIRLSEYQEQGINEGQWTGIFDLTGYKENKNHRMIVEDGIIEMINVINSSNRILSGVTDASGRRPPDLQQMMHIRKRINAFLTRPNQTIFNSLLFNYKVLNKQKSGRQRDLIDLFYGLAKEDYTNQSSILKAIYSKKMKTPIARNNIFNIDPEVSQKDGRKNIHKVGVGGIIADMFGVHLHDKSSWVNAGKKAEDSKTVYNMLDRIEASFLLGTPESINSLITDNKISSDWMNWMESEGFGSESTFAKFGEVFDRKLKNYDIGKIQNYSLLHHIIDKESSSIRNFINSNENNKFKTDSMERARFKLKTLDVVKDILLDKESELIGFGLDKKKSPAQKYFKFRDYDLRRADSGMRVTNRDQDFKYVYTVDSTRNGKIRYSFYGTLSPLSHGISGKKFLRKGKRYVIMQNPIKYELQTSREVKDSYSLLDVTGEAIASDIENFRFGTEDAFYDRLGQLRKDFYELNTEIFKMSEKSAFAQKNWVFAKEKEEGMIRNFFEQTATDVTDGVLTPQAIHTVASILIKPRQIPTMVKITPEGSPLLFPAFKPNKRMTYAVERYLHSRWNEAGIRDVYASIFGAYGKAYRRKNDRIMDSNEEAMYVSRLYSNNEPLYPSRDPMLDLAFGREGFLYIPSILQRVRGSLKEYGGRPFKTYDAWGNTKRMLSYEDIGSHSHNTLVDHFSSARNYKTSVDTKEICP